MSEIQDGVFMAKFDGASVQADSTDEPVYEIASKFYDVHGHWRTRWMGHDLKEPI